jgi:threonine/homoserine/homoserine lactone efflux protein
MNTWPTVILVTSLAVISPGADFAMVTRTSLMESRRAGLWVALGIGCGVLIHVAYTLLGLGMVLQRLPWLFNLLKYAGAAYLVWLGISLARRQPCKWGSARVPIQCRARPAQCTQRPCARPLAFCPGLSDQCTQSQDSAVHPQPVHANRRPCRAHAHPVGLRPFRRHGPRAVVCAGSLFFSAPVLQPKVQAIRPWVDRSLGCVLLVLGLLLITTGTPATSNLMNAGI